MRTAIVMGVAALALAACTTSNTIDGHQVRATAEPPVEIVSDNYLHRGAPQWFKDYWARYLRQAEGYGVLAVDRNGRGAMYVYCMQSCQNANLASARGSIDVNYKHRALKDCAEYVRQEYPAEKPACEIYAIKDKIVWKGRMPWE